MKSFLFLFSFLFFVATPSALKAAACDEDCSTSSNCTTSGCQVCIGTCVGCHELADPTSCAASETGASTYCSWMTTANRCGYIGEVPETPHQTVRYILWIVLIFATLFSIKLAVRRKRLNPP